MYTSSVYCKVILHATKYPHCAVNGVLLTECPNKSKDLNQQQSTVFLDIVPIFYLCLQVSPIVEIIF